MANFLNLAIFNPFLPVPLQLSLFQRRILLNGISLSIITPLTKLPLKIDILYPILRIFSTTYKGPPSSARWI
jgi:hypothetical protein